MLTLPTSTIGKTTNLLVKEEILLFKNEKKINYFLLVVNITKALICILLANLLTITST